MEDELLHVLDAGKGDAMILECGPKDSRQFILIDAGPPAYGRGLASTASAIKGEKPFTGVVISHPDEDHYGGLSQTLGSDTRSATLDIPVFVPQPGDENGGAKTTEALDRVFLTPGRAHGILKENTPDDPYLFSALIAIHPPRTSVRYYTRQDDPRLDARTPDAHNGSRSMIMYTKRPQTQAKYGIFFNGGTHPNIVHEYMTRTWPNAIPRFAISQIRHHPREKKPWSPRYSANLRAEAVLYALNRVRRGFTLAITLRNPETIHAAARCFMAALDALLGSHEEALAYCKALEERAENIQQKLDAAREPHADDLEVFIDRVLPPPAQPATEVVQRIHNQMCDNSSPSQQEDWMHFVRRAETGEFDAYLAVRDSKEFYATFQSDVYLVGSNSTHIDQVTETLLGLALAVKGQKRPARAFVTGPASVDIQRLVDLSALVKSNSEELFNANGLRISFLNHGPFMSLSAEPRPGQNAEYSMDRDTNASTTTIDFTQVTDAAVKRLAETMEKCLPSPVQKGGKVRIVCADTDPPQYLNIGHFDGHFQARVGDSPQDIWLDANVIGRHHHHGTIRCRESQYGLEYVDLVCTWATVDKERRMLYNISQEPGSLIFYRDREKRAQLGISPPPDSLIPFLLTPEEGNAQTITTEQLFAVEKAASMTKRISGLQRIAESKGAQPDTTQMTLSDFLTSHRAHHKPDEYRTAGGALLVLLGEKNFQSLFTNTHSLKFLDAFFLNTIKAETSSVMTVVADAGVAIKSATLDVLLDSTSTINMDGKTADIAHSQVLLSWETSGHLHVTINAVTSDDQTLSIQKSADGAEQPSVSLSDALQEAGIKLSPEDADLPRLLSVILGSPEIMFTRLSEQLPGILLKNGFDTHLVDLGSSAARVTHTPIGGPVISQAELLCQPSSKTAAWPESWDMAGLSLKLSDIRVSIQNTQLRTETVTVQGAASLLHDKSKLQFIMSSSLEKTQSIMSFQLTSGSIRDMIHDLAEALSITEASNRNADEILGIPLPFTSDAGETTILELEDDPDLLQEAGFMLKQSIRGIASYQLDSIYVKAPLSGWKTYLPTIEAKDLTSSAVIRIRDPFRKASRRVDADVSFTLPVATSNKVVIQVNARFSASQSTAQGKYEYALSIIDCPAGVTIHDLVTTLGIPDMSTQLVDGYPLLKGAQGNVQLRGLSAFLEQSDKGIKLGDCTLDIYIPLLDAIPALLPVTDLRLRLESIAGEWTAKGKATCRSEEYSTICDMELTMPDARSPGHIRLEPPGNLSLRHIIQGLELGYVGDIPLLGKVLDAELVSLEGTVGYQNDKLALLKVAAKSHTPELSLGAIRLDDVDFSVDWSVGEVVSPTQHSSVFNFTAHGLLAVRPCLARLEYNAVRQTLTGSLRSFARQPMKIAEILRILVPDKKTALDQFVADVSMNAVDLDFDLTGAVQSFVLRSVNGDTLRLPKTDASKTILLTGVKLEYHPTKLAEAATAQEPVTFRLTGRLQIEDVEMEMRLLYKEFEAPDGHSVGLSIRTSDASKARSLGLQSFLQHLGIGYPTFDVPEDSPPFFVGQEEITGQYGAVQSTEDVKLNLLTLAVTAKTTVQVVVFESPKVALQTLLVKIEYNAAKEAEPISATVHGILPIASVPLDLVYQRHDGYGEFHADIQRLSEDQQIDIQTLLPRFLAEDDYDISTLQASSEKLPLEGLHLSIKPKESILLISQGTHPTTVKSCGVQFDIHGLGLRLTVTHIRNPDHKIPGQKSYSHSVFLGGPMTLSGFGSGLAWLNIQTGQPAIWSITVNTGDGGSGQLQQLTGSITQEGGSWNDLVKDLADLRFGGTDAQFLVDQARNLLLLEGEIAELGRGQLLAKPQESGTGYSYFFSLAVRDVEKVWKSPQLKDDICTPFDLRGVSVSVISHQISVEGLKMNLLESKALLQSSQSIPGLEDDPAYPRHPTPHMAIEPSSIPLDEKTNLEAGAWLIGPLGFDGDHEMAKALSLAAAKTTVPTMTLFTNISNTNRQHQVFVENFTLAGGSAIIRGTGKHDKTATPANINIKADVDIIGLDTPLKLKATVTLEEKKTVINGEALAISISNPFKGMFNVTVSDPKLDGTIVDAENPVLSITAKARFAGHDKWMPCTLHFPYKKPSLLVIEYSKELDPDGKEAVVLRTGDDLFSHLISPISEGHPAQWPSEFPVLHLTNGFIYFNTYKEFIDAVQSRIHHMGFWIGARMDLFGKEFRIEAHLMPNASGIDIHGVRAAPVDFAFARLIGPKREGSQNRISGPLVSIRAFQQHSTFIVWTGLEFMETEMFDLELQYDKTKGAFTGIAQFNAGKMASSTLSLVYQDTASTSNNLSFENWNVDMDIDVDVDNAVRSVHSTQSDAFLERILDDSVKARFHINIQVPNDKSSLIKDDVMHLYLGVQCTISVAGENLGKFPVYKPTQGDKNGPLHLEFVKPWSIDSLWNQVRDAITSHAKDIGPGILNDSEIFGKILARVPIKHFSAKTFIAIFDWNVRNHDVAQAGKAVARNKWLELKGEISKAGQTWDKFTQAVADGQLVTALVAFGRFAEIALWISVGVSTLLKLLRPLKDVFAGDEYAQEKQEIEEMEQLDAEKTKLENQRAQALQDLDSLSRLKTFVTAKFDPDTDKRLIVQWNNEALPAEQCNIQRTKWMIKYGLDEKLVTPSVQTLPSTTGTVSIEDTRFPYAPKVFVQVAASFQVSLGSRPGEASVGDLAFSLDCSTPDPASHPAFLPTPTHMALSVEGGNPKLSFKALTAGRYQLELYAVSCANKMPLCRNLFTVEDPPPVFKMQAELISRDLGDFNGLVDAVTGRFRAFPSDRTVYRESEWYECPDQIKGKKYLEEGRVDMVNEKARVSWKAAEYKRYLVDMWWADKHITVEVSGEGQITANGRTSVVVGTPSWIEEQEVLSIAVAPMDIDSDECVVACVSYLDVYYLPNIKIEDETVTYNMNSHELGLVLPYGVERGSWFDAWLECTAQDGSISEIELKDIPWVLKLNQKASTTVKNIQNPYPASLAIITRNKSRTHTARGPSWTFFQVPSQGLPACTQLSVVVREGKMVVSWATAPGVSTARVVVSKEGGETLASEEVSWSSLAGGESRSLDLNAVQVLPGTSYTIRIISRHGHQFFGGVASIEYRSPKDFTLWTEPALAHPDFRPLARESEFTFAIRQGIPTFFWWADGRNLYAGRTQDSPYIKLVSDSTTPAFGGFSGLASTSVGDNHEEVYFIDDQGRVKGGLNEQGNSPPDKNWPQGAYKFNNDRAAVTQRGGAITAAVDRASNTLHVWWVRPQWNSYTKAWLPSIAYSNCPPNIWWTESQEWYKQDTMWVYQDSKGLGAMASATAEGGYATLWCFSHDLGLISVTRRMGDTSENCVNYDVPDQNLKEETGMSPESGICVINVSPHQHRVFWITRTGGVMTALVTASEIIRRKRPYGFSDPVSCKSQVAPPNSACIRSGIAAVHAPGGDERDLRVWWFADDGRLIGAKARDGRADKPKWMKYDQAPAGSGRRTGRMQVAVSTWTRPLIRVWWVDADERIKWQAPTATLQ